MKYLDSLKEKILASGILDQKNLHHEFVSGTHGRKLDFDSIPTGSELYIEWVAAYVKFIQENYPKQPDVILGIANGANRLAVSIASALKDKAIGLTTEKITAKSVGLSEKAKEYISSHTPDFVLVVEDAGTSGTTSATAAVAVIKAGAKNAAVLNTWQRRAHLEKLDEAKIDYKSLIIELLPTYSPKDCLYCKQGVKLIRHD